jgi:hypothetical protein
MLPGLQTRLFSDEALELKATLFVFFNNHNQLIAFVTVWMMDWCSRAFDRGSIGVFYASKMPKIHLEMM